MGVCLSVLFGAFVLLVFLGAEDAVLKRQLRQALNDYAQTESPMAQPLHFFVGPASRLPEALAPSLRQRGDGYHEMSSDAYEYHVAITSPPDGGERLYAMIRLPDNEWAERLLWLAIFVGAVGTSLVGYGLGRGIAFRVASPLSELVQCVEQDDPSACIAALVPRLQPDEIGQLAATLADYVRQREATLNREARFIQDVSHELRTPITIVQGAYDVLRESLQAEPDRERLERIGRSATRMHHTVQSLLWLAREERRWRQHPVPFAQQFESMIEEYRAILPTGISLRAEMESVSPDAFEGALLTVALSNLIRNALDHAACQHIRVVVRADAAEVEDDGCGIDPARLPRILERAQRGEVNDNGGVGLSLVSRLSRRFAWSLQIESEVGRGTRVMIHLSQVSGASPEHGLPSC
ncbi:sensor histidine kinase [Candidatus Entotheonella palauensis]|uniref:sensor histidine kinase n=1 Tax=Candidatus Entotheonella palauensis TaxID=93172 RepID=UPI0015C45C11|nr:HAMP domain-containing sensor histidine kinase [Candidatus Entotheonella palauensis]